MKALNDHSLGARPFRNLVRSAIVEADYDAEKVATALGFAKPEQVTLYIDGEGSVPLAGALGFAALTETDVVVVARAWLAECQPDLLEFLDILPAPLLLSMNERRCIRHIREFTQGTNAKLIVADGRDLLAVVMV